MATALSFEHVTKRYQGARTYAALRDDVMHVMKRAIGRREPPVVVQALDDVSFEIPQGQALGLIGDNGAGKTTLLKLATRITYPTSGRITARGRIGALIEVGTGLHPELTGRENVKLYGRILGLSGRDIDARFDGITDFAGIGAAIDQPVKQYSSGMQLRLGFSLASHLEPDILLVDEAIAVGDAAFQFRCIERMAELVREGRTLLLVSHDMRAIASLCDTVVLLEDGRVATIGPAPQVVAQYLEHSRQQVQPRNYGQEEGDSGIPMSGVSIQGFDLLDESGRPTRDLRFGEAPRIRMHIRAHRRIDRPLINFGIKRSDGVIVCNFNNFYDGFDVGVVEGEATLEGWLPPIRLIPGDYEAHVLVWAWGGGRPGTDALGSRPLAGASFGHLRVQGPPLTDQDGVFQIPAKRWRFTSGGLAIEHVVDRAAEPSPPNERPGEASGP